MRAGNLQIILQVKRVAARIEAVAPDGEKYTKPKGKERTTEAPLPFVVLLFFIVGTTSGKPVAALKKIYKVLVAQTHAYTFGGFYEC